MQNTGTIRTKFIKKSVKMKKECDSIFNILPNIKSEDRYDMVVKTEYELCDKYFKATIANDLKKFSDNIDGFLGSDLISFGENENSQGAAMAKDMCLEIQKIKVKYLKKNKKQITFKDFEDMNREISTVIADAYKKRNIKLVPLDEHLTMSCWMVKSTTNMKAVLAFPSKYSSDEIGFYSQDDAFSKYIFTMLDGILLNQQFEGDI